MLEANWAQSERRWVKSVSGIARAGLLEVQHDLPVVVDKDPGLVGGTPEPQRGSTAEPRVSEAAEPLSATLGCRSPPAALTL
jgi:hypothetical protein